MAGLAPNGGQQAGDWGTNAHGRALLCDLAARLEARAAPIAAEVADLVGRSSGPAGPTAELVDTHAFVCAVAQSLRSGRRRSDPALLERWRAFGRRKAADEEALSRLIETLDLQAEMVIESLVAEWSTLSAAGRTVEAYLMSTTMALAATRMATVTEAYLDTCLQRRSGRRSAGDATPGRGGGRRRRLDRVCTRSRSTDGARVHRRGRRPGRLGVVCRRRGPRPPGASGRVLADDRDDGCVCGRRSAASASSSCPMTDDGTSGHVAVDMLCAEAGEHIPDARLRVAIAGPHAGQAGVTPRLRTGPAHARGCRAAGMARRGEPGRRPAPGPPGVGARRRRRAGRAWWFPSPSRIAPPATWWRRCVSTWRPVCRWTRPPRPLACTRARCGRRLGRIERLLGGRIGDRAAVLQLGLLACDLGLAGSVVVTDDTRRDPP